MSIAPLMSKKGISIAVREARREEAQANAAADAAALRRQDDRAKRKGMKRSLKALRDIKRLFRDLDVVEDFFYAVRFPGGWFPNVTHS